MTTPLAYHVVVSFTAETADTAIAMKNEIDTNLSSVVGRLDLIHGKSVRPVTAYDVNAFGVELPEGHTEEALPV